jgi:ABC-type branched-subunit amino acid transport system substrate-binding protein
MKTYSMMGVFTFVLAAGCGGSSDGSKTSIVVGAAFDMTGANATPSFINSLKLAVADVNSALKKANSEKYKSLKIDLIIEDTANDNAQAAMRATQLKGEGAKGLIVQQAPTSQAANALNYDSEPTNDLNIPLVCPNCKVANIHNPTATDPKPELQDALRDPNHWWFLTEMNGNQDTDIRTFQTVGANNGGDLNRDGHLKLAVWAGNMSVLDGFRRRIANDAKMLDANAIVEDQVQFDTNANLATYDFSRDMTQLGDNATAGTTDFIPDAILLQAPQGFEAGLVKANKNGGYNIPLIHSANFRSGLAIQALAELAEGEEGTSPPIVADSASGATFLSEYTSAYAVSPETEDANCYDAVATLALALVIAVENNHLASPDLVTGTQVRDAMAKTSDKSTGTTVIGSGPAEFAKAIDLIVAGQPIDFDGASGPVDFDEVGGVLGKIAHWKVVNHQFVEDGLYDCTSPPGCTAQAK